MDSDRTYQLIRIKKEQKVNQSVNLVDLPSVGQAKQDQDAYIDDKRT